MYDDDQDALAAEYVLGTLGADEREQAKALLAIDAGFAAVVRSWERRLGELNVMVEAVEPPAQTWDKIKAAAGIEASGATSLPLIAEAPTAAPAGEAPPTEAPTPSPSEASPGILPPSPADVKIERSADVIYLARRVKRWRRMTIATGALAAVLALAIIVPNVVPDAVPAGLQFLRLFQKAPPPPKNGPMVAVLQREPGEPAFLLTIDPVKRMLTVRRVSATPEPNRSYELWLLAGSSSAPRSLGVVGVDEFTQHPVPANVETDVMNSATYAVSLEPAGGSPSGAPTGPVLFKGAPFESVPVNAPAPRT